MSKSIGEQGDHLNFSVATRAVNLESDPAYFKKNDEYFEKNKKSFNKSLFWSIGFVVISIKLFLASHFIIGSITILISLFLLFILFNINIKLRGLVYKNGLLIPGIITQLNPLKIVVLADVTDGTSDEEIWGLRQLSVKYLPSHNLVLGERIPCVSLFGMALKGIRRYIEPHPLCWGTNNQSILVEAETAIDAREWEILEVLKNKIKVDEDEETATFFDSELQPYDVYNKKIVTESPTNQSTDLNLLISQRAQQLVAIHPEKNLDYSLPSIEIIESMVDEYVTQGNLQAGNIQYITENIGSYLLQTYSNNFKGKFEISTDYEEPQTFFVSDGVNHFISVFPIQQLILKIKKNTPICLVNTCHLFTKAVANAKEGEVDMYI